MLEMLGFFAILAAIFYLIFPFILSSRIRELTTRIQELEKRFGEGTTMPETSRPLENEKPSQKEEKPIQVREASPKVAKTVSAPANSPSTIPSPQKQERIEKIQEPAQRSEAWQRFEKQIAENWTGILGTIILVMGVGFLGIYAALNMSPFFRFLMVLGIGLALFGTSVFLIRKDFWEQIGYWLRSGSGAVVLFACVSSASVPGMKWIQSEFLALVLILVGVTINLALAWFSSLQRFASLHIILSLVSLAILPFTTLIFFLGMGVSFFSVLLSYRAKWEFHLLQTTLSFLVLNFIYKTHFSLAAPILDSMQSRTWGILGTLLVGVAAILVHYRKVYSSEKFEALPFVTHLFSWAGIGLGLALYSTGSVWNPLILILSSVLLFFWARTARETKKIRWLYLTDSLVSLSIAFVGVLLLSRLEIDKFAITVFSSLLFSIFFIVASEEKETFLQKVGAALLHFSWGLFLLLLLEDQSSSNKVGFISTTVTCLGMLALSFGIQIYDSIRNKNSATAVDDIYGLLEGHKISPSGIFAGLFASAICFLAFPWQYSEFYLPIFGIVLLAIRQNRNWNGLGIGLFPFLLALHALVIYRISHLEPWDILLRDLPAIVFSFLCIPLSRIKLNSEKTLYFSQPGAILFSSHILFLSYWVANPISPFLPGILWLLLSVFYLEAKVFFEKKQETWNQSWKSSIIASRNVWAVFAISFVVLFLGAHILVHLQSEYSFGIFKIRFLIQIFAIAIFLYWATSSSSQTFDTLWDRILPFFWELSAIMATIAIALEVPNQWLAVGWILWAFLLEWIGYKFHARVSRFRFYSLCFFWYSCIHVGFVSSTNTTPSLYWADQEWFGGLIAILLLTVYLVRMYKLPYRAGSEAEGFPSTIKQIAEKLEPRYNIAIFYPLFAAIALFLYWSFDSSLLTLLWMVEVFIVFVIGLLLKEEHFRYVSLGAMIVCLVRLIFWDLSNSSTITRALVFLGVGGILILMNTLYGKFKSKEGSDAA
ncbi:DUF2339 domain-containing protein [Leptospira langatensis]|uniref:DUF2339 domain-containing protein n=1 Tax=Leptospira langatensis TaxID=2484983 RepID=A0A5F1ZVE6_9LEPT|nr:DUF2339 domain-containing protein [Leptospira langatensis]TGK03062.1 DUF2339 domain-containing protein [Leptospira langatensis]TGL41818.1 DUF2339 domain-containing protein [Leptospira langatensis]